MKFWGTGVEGEEEERELRGIRWDSSRRRGREGIRWERKRGGRWGSGRVTKEGKKGEKWRGRRSEGNRARWKGSKRGGRSRVTRWEEG